MTVKINKELFARAVDAKIRPLLIDRGYLDDPDHESYQHSTVIPKAQLLLSRPSLEKDARKAVAGAINASVNLLSQFETIQATDFIKECQSMEVRDRTIELLHGGGELGDRIATFVKWGGMREKKKGKETQKIGLNATTVSYLLSMSAPALYAFCKPSVYKGAVQVLLGKDQVESDPIRRIVHCTDFYKTALELFRTRHGLDRFTDLMYCHIAFYIMGSSD